MPKFTNIGSFIFLAIFTPLTFLMLVSQNTVPGDLLYPIKRFFEGGILVASSVHPTTRAMFQSNLADRRFTEVEKVILARQDYSGLPEFVITVARAQQQIAQVSDGKTKSDLEEELISSINTYQEKLAEVKTQIVYVPQIIREERIVRDERFLPSNQSPTPIKSGPTTTSITVQEPSVEPTAAVSVGLPPDTSSADDLTQAIDEAHEELERVKERLEQEQKMTDDGQENNKNKKEEDNKKDKKEKNDDGKAKENKGKD